MTKIHKSVLRSSIVMLSLFALTVAGSGVAQAQRCKAYEMMPNVVRAEGITETVGGIELRCVAPTMSADPLDASSEVPTDVEITVELNTRITNPISDERDIEGAPTITYTTAYIRGGMDPDAMAFTGAAKLSDDGTTLEWKIPSANLNLGTAGEGFKVDIIGIRANASTVGDDEDITAVVRIGGSAVHDGSLKLADVTTGLVVKVAGADILQCQVEDLAGGTATITIQEGFVNSIVDTNEFVVTFIGIPEGVTVKVPVTEPALTMGGDVSLEMAMASFGLMLKTGTRASGVTVETGATTGTVDLSLAGTGEVTYKVTDTNFDVKEEWVKLTVTFEWASGSVVDSGEVVVSFDPVSAVGGDTYDIDGAPSERYVATSGSTTIISVSPCETTLLFPFVTGKHGYTTGIAITNTSDQEGSCTATFTGEDAPDSMDSPVESERQWVFMTAMGFQGYLTAECGFQGGKGFAFVANPAVGAHGYLAEEVQ